MADSEQSVFSLVGEEDDKSPKRAEDINPRSNELVIGLVGYAGAGFSRVADKLADLLGQLDYQVELIKLSQLIEAKIGEDVPARAAGEDKGEFALARAYRLQDLGDQLRGRHGDYAVASLAVQDIRDKRSGSSEGDGRRAYILDSIKHPTEIDLLRRVYDKSFRLIAIHADRDERLKRLSGPKGAEGKFAGALDDNVEDFLHRDESDLTNKRGQQVRKAFHLADFFLDNNRPVRGSDNPPFVDDLKRFCELVLGTVPVGPKLEEVGMYHAYAASLQSSCLSRQVGASVLDTSGNLLSTGANEVPKFGGGVYSGSATRNDGRCYVWQGGDEGFVGCHNTHRKNRIKKDLGAWLSNVLEDDLSAVIERYIEDDLSRSQVREEILGLVSTSFERERKIPHIGDLIEFARSVHAEMNAIITAGRTGNSVEGGTLFTTTYPCHNCTRHIVAAGIKEVRFIEPYVKSLATELHNDAVKVSSEEAGDKMLIIPFTGVGPRMYEDYFMKMGENKNSETGAFEGNNAQGHLLGVRQLDIESVEKSAAELIGTE